MDVKIFDPEEGDRDEKGLTPVRAGQLMLLERQKGRVGFVKFTDDTQLTLPQVPRTYTAAQIQDMLESTGILEQLEEKEALGLDATLVPAVGGG